MADDNGRQLLSGFQRLRNEEISGDLHIVYIGKRHGFAVHLVADVEIIGSAGHIAGRQGRIGYQTRRVFRYIGRGGQPAES
jgi:hypothetical protein